MNESFLLQGERSHELMVAGERGANKVCSPKFGSIISDSTVLNRHFCTIILITFKGFSEFYPVD